MRAKCSSCSIIYSFAEGRNPPPCPFKLCPQIYQKTSESQPTYNLYSDILCHCGKPIGDILRVGKEKLQWWKIDEENYTDMGPSFLDLIRDTMHCLFKSVQRTLQKVKQIQETNKKVINILKDFQQKKKNEQNHKLLKSNDE